MSDVIDAQVVEPDPRADGFPRRVDVGHVPARLVSRNDPGIAGRTRQRRENAGRRLREVNRAGASIRIGQLDAIVLDEFPMQALDLQKSAACLQQQAEGGDRRGHLAFGLAEDFAQTLGRLR